MKARVLTQVFSLYLYSYCKSYNIQHFIKHMLSQDSLIVFFFSFFRLNITNTNNTTTVTDKHNNMYSLNSVCHDGMSLSMLN